MNLEVVKKPGITFMEPVYFLVACLSMIQIAQDLTLLLYTKQE